MQHQLMQQQHTSHVTSDHIQQYLDENKALILNILENQSTGKFSECAENQSRLQQNLMYLAAIADCQPKQSPIHLQPYANAMQQQQQMQMQSQPRVQQSHTMAQSHTGFGQQSLFTMHQQALQSQIGIGSTGTSVTHAPLHGTGLEGEGSGLAQSVFGDNGSGGLSGATRWSTPKESMSTGSIEGIGSSHPQKKGKLNTTGC